MKKQFSVILISWAILQTPIAFATGRESGGGDPLALEFKATAQVALKNLQSLDKTAFGNVNFSQLQSEILSAQILVSDSPLPVTKDGVVQVGAAENRPSQNLIILNRADYTKIQNVVVQQALALHEFLSLEGLESTGNYPISGAYLIAEGGGTTTVVKQTIDSASKSLAVETPCSKPSSTVSALFSMIADENSPAQAIQSYIENHIISIDAVNDQCKTMFDSSVDKNRTDVFSVFFDHYKPDLNAPETQGKDSVYSYTLAHGSLALLKQVEKDALSSGQKLTLAPTNPLYPGGTTPLILASEFNPSVEVLRHLLQQGASINGSDSKGDTALIQAATTNPNTDVALTLLANGANPNSADSDKITALMMAARNDNADLVNALLKKGALVNAKDSDDYTALFDAVSFSTTTPQESLIETVRALLKAGAEVNLTDANGFTPLTSAVLEWNFFMPSDPTVPTELVQILIESGANPNVTDTHSMTPLMNALSEKNLSLFRILLQEGADINVTASNGTSVLIYAAGNSAAEFMSALIQAGAKIDIPYDGMTPLLYAVTYNSDPGTTQALIDAGANVNEVDSNGKTVLMTAVSKNTNADVTRTLMKAGAKINAADSNGTTALMYAAYPHYKSWTILENDGYQEDLQDQLITMLIQAGANRTAQNSSGKSALDIAKENDAPTSILKLLGN